MIVITADNLTITLILLHSTFLGREQEKIQTRVRVLLTSRDSMKMYSIKGF